MSELNLNADHRQLTGRKVGQLRRQGIIPVVVYGNVQEPVNLQVQARDSGAHASCLAAPRVYLR